MDGTGDDHGRIRLDVLTRSRPGVGGLERAAVLAVARAPDDAGVRVGPPQHRQATPLEGGRPGGTDVRPTLVPAHAEEADAGEDDDQQRQFQQPTGASGPWPRSRRRAGIEERVDRLARVSTLMGLRGSRVAPRSKRFVPVARHLHTALPPGDVSRPSGRWRPGRRFLCWADAPVRPGRRREPTPPLEPAMIVPEDLHQVPLLSAVPQHELETISSRAAELHVDEGDYRSTRGRRRRSTCCSAGASCSRRSWAAPITRSASTSRVTSSARSRCCSARRPWRRCGPCRPAGWRGWMTATSGR